MFFIHYLTFNWKESAAWCIFFEDLIFLFEAFPLSMFTFILFQRYLFLSFLVFIYKKLKVIDFIHSQLKLLSFAISLKHYLILILIDIILHSCQILSNAILSVFLLFKHYCLKFQSNNVEFQSTFIQFIILSH